MQSYPMSDVAWFFSKNDPRWELSNMAGDMPVYWPLGRQVANRWNSAEQLYQACKYGTEVSCTPESSPDADPNVRRRIRRATNARGAKMTQKCAVKAGLVRGDWEAPDEVRVKAMEWVLELKAYWNPSTFGRVLRGTEERVIVEVSRKDTFWGCRDDGAGNLTGDNQLGQALMRVRGRLPQVLRGEFTYPEGFLLP